MRLNTLGGINLLLAAFAIVLGVAATALWPMINDVKTGETPQYPDIHPQRFAQPYDRVFNAALAAAGALRLDISAQDREQGEIRAVATTALLRFRDDVTITLRRDGASVEVNVRSRSRVGKGDFGTNARRIRRFQEELAKRL
ncbi:DUF1499 domain-containing protein [Methylogaea oryzae]|uniref:DUF1499 domain-containing protein n=2 Tax=Methylogaea oryzae TaxID=1295382 RepID=A0A8D4VSI6_9GAMM|nr:DUF1499 domain-containing protein [Methylogaea oryzae]BBL71772.1 hypothetical protein MoryE10_23780 [Methylogaea oryzae]